MEIAAARFVVGKALGPILSGLLEPWAASSELGTKVRDLKMQLLYAQGMLDNSRGRDLRSPALAELLLELRQLAYKADDALDEMDYFRIQDELDGTYETSDADARGLLQGLALNGYHAARAVASKLKLPSCSCKCAAGCSRPDEEHDDVRQGCLSGACSCRGNQGDANQSIQDTGGCLPKVIASKAHAVGKRLPCYSLPSVQDSARAGPGMLDPSTPGSSRRFLCGAWQTKGQQTKPGVPTPKLKFDRVKMSKKITDIVEQLKPICAMVSTILGLELVGSNRSTIPGTELDDRPKTTPQIIEPNIIVRDNQIENVVADITHGKYSANDLTVLPIVGLGGIGKTTFIQHIYDKVKSHFQVSIWICVSHNFNVNTLAQEILKQIPSVQDEKGSASVEELIEKRLHSKRFLLVLDDMWTYREDEWMKLLAPFRKVGTKDNMVIVTTRIPHVAKNVGTKDCSINLERLDPEDCMRLFRACAFGSQQSWKDHADLHNVGEKILKRLKGSPLAVKTVGRLLRNQLDYKHWNIVLESKEWELQTDNDDIMPELMLSYSYLPFHVQQCFSHCALFPEDYEFTSEELIHLWIGLGLLGNSDHNIRIEDIGLGNLNILVNHGFFIKREKNNQSYYVIHDLLHELAVNVSSYECLSLHSSNVRSIQIPASIRHLSVTVDDTVVADRTTFENFRSDLSTLHKRLKVQNLRTLMLFGEHHGSFAKIFSDLFREAKSLRVISLFGASCSVHDLFHNFSNLIHLRYLRIKDTDCTTTGSPSSISRLYHLRVLDVQKFASHFSSVRDMSNLVKIRHFCVKDDRLHSGIFMVGTLIFLQELRSFEVKRETNGFELKQIGQLLQLRGSLGIYNLERVQSRREADEAKLSHLNHLEGLLLVWDMKRSNKNPKQEEDVLESLKPHCNLRKLSIEGHGGDTCPTWLGGELSFENLESLHLIGVTWNMLPLPGNLCMVNEDGAECEGCVTSQGLQNLKRLKLVNIPRLKIWRGNEACHLLSHLEELEVRDCSELTELPFSQFICHPPQEEKNLTWFPKLQSIEISCCPNLLSLPSIPWTRGECYAYVKQVGLGFEELSYSNDGKHNSLYITGKGALDSEFWNVFDFSYLTELQVLRITNCSVPMDKLNMLASLKTLNIDNCNNVLWPVEREDKISWVEELSIINCGANGKDLTELLSHFRNLLSLFIHGCEKILGLGVMGQQATTTLSSCPLMSADKTDQIEISELEQQPGGEEQIEAMAEGLLLLPFQIQRLGIGFCPQLSLLCSQLDEGTTGRAGLGGLSCLRSLSIYGCPKFLLSSNSPPSSYFPFPTTLQSLDIRYPEGTLTLAPLINLNDLSIYGDARCEGLWPLLAQGRLTTLSLPRVSEFEPDICGSSRLQTLRTADVAGLLVTPICRLLSSSLTKLVFSDNDEVETFTKDQEEALQILTSLQELEFVGLKKLQSLPAGLTRLPNLKRIEICGCPALQSMPKDGLPSSLEELDISYCEAMRALPKDSLPSSLKELKMFHCPAMQSLPKGGLPSSLIELDVRGCDNEELRKQCCKLKGTIPIIRLD